MRECQDSITLASMLDRVANLTILTATRLAAEASEGRWIQTMNLSARSGARSVRCRRVGLV